MRLPSSLRPVLTATVLGSALVLVGCSGGGGAGGGAADEQSSAEGAEADDSGSGAAIGGEPETVYTDDQIRTAIESVDLDGASFSVSESSDLGDFSFDPSEVGIEPAECATAYEEAVGHMPDSSSGVVGIAQDSGMSAGGIALDSSEAVEEAITAQESLVAPCATMTIDMEGTGGPAESSIEPVDVGIEGATAYDMKVGFQGVEVTNTFVHLPVGSALISLIGVSTVNPDVEEDLVSAAEQIRDSLESQAG